MIQEHLREAEQMVYSDDECRKIHHEIIHPSHIYAGYPGRGKCSLRPQDCGGFHPGVFSQVSYYNEWIRQVSGV